LPSAVISRAFRMAAPNVLLRSISTPTFEPLDKTAATTPSKRKWEEMAPLALVDDMPAEFEVPEKVTFNPDLHLSFEPPTKVHTMKELGLGDKGISPVAVS